MKTLQEIQDNYLAIDFFLSMSCNKDCHYCTSYTLEMRNLTVDIDFLKQTLHYLRNYKIIEQLNLYLRDKSYLYMFIKGIGTDPSKRWFSNILNEYKKILKKMNRSL